MGDDALPTEIRLARDGKTWRIGTSVEVDWIVDGTGIGTTITAAIPPLFAAYATVTLADHDAGRDGHDQAMVQLLREQSPDQPWWLGYLDTGSDDIVFPAAPMVTLYTGWRYVLVEAGPDQAVAWRTNDHRSVRGALPDLTFPADRSWLVSRLWDDEWRCIGGPAAFIEKVRRDVRLRGRLVELGHDATPPGHRSI